MNLKEKNCLVTGGSSGIGKSIALMLAQLGANVAITYARSADAASEVVKEIESKGVKGLSFQADAIDFERAEEVINEIVKEWGTLDALVNNAGITKIT
jgi:3-oxoacyl-[acyl-carrier protein] reductase